MNAFEKAGPARIVQVVLTVALMFVCAFSSSLSAQPGNAPPPVLDETGKTEKLARDVERAISLRHVKDLQFTLSEYAQYGLIDELVSLFSEDAVIELVYNNSTISGDKAIRDYWVDRIGTRNGLGPGQLYNHLVMTPVVTLNYDGMGATGRWTDLVMRGRVDGEADWLGGMQVNDYIRDDGVWKISRMRVYHQLEGSCNDGFFAAYEELPIVPYHYTPALAGRPVPAEPGDTDRSPRELSLAQVESQIEAMNDEDEVRNLQHIYGYYVDCKMWDDVADLFAADGAMEIAGIGIYEGVDSIRRGLERDGPVGLQYGQVNDQIQFHTVVEVDPGGVEARARGTQLGMLTPELGKAYWMVSTFESRYVKQDGLWRIREMRIYPKMKADYYQGWHKSVVIDPVPTGNLAPDRESSADNSPQTSAVIPAFFNNPVTGRPVVCPKGYRAVGEDRLVAAPEVGGMALAGGEFDERLAAARRKLDASKAYDAIYNISSSLGNYLDDWIWDEFSQIMAENGTRPQGRGFYIGRDNVYLSMTESHLAPPSASNPRDGIRLHHRIQPVIHVTPDARSAKIRTRMFLYFANQVRAGAWNSGMYPNDTAVLEDGVWKFEVGGVIDETYFRSTTYEDGWAKPELDENGKPLPRRMPVAAEGPSRNGNPISFEPDIPWTLFDDYRRKDFHSTNYPDIKPMWFHYRNPISGRTPEFYCPEILKCFAP